MTGKCGLHEIFTPEYWCSIMTKVYLNYIFVLKLNYWKNLIWSIIWCSGARDCVMSSKGRNVDKYANEAGGLILYWFISEQCVWKDCLLFDLLDYLYYQTEKLWQGVWMLLTEVVERIIGGHIQLWNRQRTRAWDSNFGVYCRH